MAKIGGLKLKLAISESNLTARVNELEETKRKLYEVINERDFLRKVVLNLSERRYG